MVLIGLLVACSGTKADGETGGVGGDDSGDSVQESGEGDSSESGDPDDSGSPDPDLIFNLEGSYSGAVLTLTWLDVSTLGTSELGLGDTLLTVTANETTGLIAGTPPDDAFIEVDPGSAPGMLAAFYLPGLYMDDDGDATHDSDEIWIGVGVDWPVYLTGEIPRELLEQGFQGGWNALHFNTDESEPELVDPLAIPLSTNLMPTQELTLGGTWSATVGPDGYGLFAAPYPMFIGETVDEFLADGPAEAAWSMSFDGEPPDDHFADLDFLTEPGALEVPIAYQDADADGAFDVSDAPVFAACLDGQPVGALWLPQSGDLGVSMTYAVQGLSPGWLALFVGDAEGLPDPERLDELEVGESCSIE